MADNQDPGTGGADPKPGGPTDDPNKNKPSDDLVKHSTYKKAVTEAKNAKDEAKRLRDENEAFKTAEKTREEDELKKNQQWEKLHASKDEELKKARGEKKELEQKFENGVKLDAFLKSVKGKVETQFFGLINLEGIAVDPSTGLPDDASVDKVAREFEETYGRVIVRDAGPGLPNDAPIPGQSLSLEQWKALPLKEMKKRMPEVMNKYI